MKNLNLRSDLELVRLYRQSSNTLYFDELHQRLYPSLYQECLEIVRDKEKADVVTKELFHQLSQIIPGFSSSTIFFSYLYELLEEKCADAFFAATNMDEVNAYQI